MNDLVVWLREQLDDDQSIADAARIGLGGDWSQRPAYDQIAPDGGHIYDENDEVVVYDEGAPSPSEAHHIMAFDPARVLREVEAKREIIAEVESWPHYHSEDSWYSCAVDPEGCADDRRAELGACDCGLLARQLRILAPLAAAYSDRPGYREEWATNG